jgi:hypothetical protein
MTSISPTHGVKSRNGTQQAAWLIASMILTFGNLLSPAAQAAVNDVFPGDYTTLPEGFATVTGYGYARRSEGPYAGGARQLDGQLDIRIAALRVTYFTKVAGMTFSPMVVMGWAGIDASPAVSAALGPDARGMIDLRLGGTLWLVENQETREYLGITGTVILPTGSYDSSRVFNIGDNRSTFVVSGGWVKPFGARTSLEISPEIAFYTDNKSYLGANRLSQDASYAVTGILRYQATTAAQVFTSLQINRGGATSINGVGQNNSASYTKLSIGGNYLTQDRQQWTLRYSRDLQFENGFKTLHELTLRYLVFF